MSTRMKNPILLSSLFVTPMTEAELDEMIRRLTPSERSIAYLYSMYTFNLCHKLVEDAMDAMEKAPVPAE